MPVIDEEKAIDIENFFAKYKASFGGKGSGIGQFQNASDVSYIGNGRILVSDMINSRLVVFRKNIYTSPCMTYQLSEIKEPVSATVTLNGDIVVTSRKSNGVYVLSRDGDIIQFFGQDLLENPSGVAVTRKGNFVITDTGSAKVLIFSAEGKFLKYAGDNDTFACPRYVAINKQGYIIVSDAGDNCIKIFNEHGDFLRSFGNTGNGKLKCPYGVACDTNGNILVADHYNDKISIFTIKGEFIRYLLTFQSGIYRPQGISLTPNQELYVTLGNMKATVIAAYSLCTFPTLFSISDSDSSIQDFTKL